MRTGFKGSRFEMTQSQKIARTVECENKFYCTKRYSIIRER